MFSALLGGAPQNEHFLFQFHVPVGMVEELLPRAVAIVTELDADDGAELGLGRFRDELHAGFFGQSAALADVALHATTHDVIPGVSAIAAARYDVVQAELGGGELLAAVLAAVAVAGKDVAAVEFDLLFGQSIVQQQPHNARHGNVESHGADPVVGMGLELSAELADLDPGLEVVAQVLAVFDVDHFSQLAKQQREGPFDVDDPDGQVVLVQHQDIAIDAGRYGCRKSWRQRTREDKPSYSVVISTVFPYLNYRIPGFDPQQATRDGRKIQRLMPSFDALPGQPPFSVHGRLAAHCGGSHSLSVN